MGKESELKFSVPEAALQKIWRLPWLRRLARARGRTEQLESVYYDTPAKDLSGAGLTLRVRRVNGSYVQTVKGNGADQSAPWVRAEDEVSLEASKPDPTRIADKELRRRVGRLIDAHELGPLFLTDIKRSSLILRPRKGVAIEMACDLGALRALGAHEGIAEPVSEVELELKSGSIRDLFEIGEKLLDAAPLRFSLSTKAARGYALSRRETGAPARAKPLSLDPKAPVSSAFAAIIINALDQLTSNEAAVIRARDPEGVHQMRVALRRMRSALSTFGRMFEGPALAEIKSETGWLAGVLGGARDLDVFQDEILKPVQQALHDDAGLFRFAATLRSERRRAWEHVLEVLGSDRYRRLTVRIAKTMALQDWTVSTGSNLTNGVAHSTSGAPGGEQDTKSAARDCLDHRLKQAKKLGKRIAELDLEERHELRIRLKKLRYIGDFTQSCFSRKRAKSFLSRLSRMQNLFGAMNDALSAKMVIDRLLAQHVSDAAPEGVTGDMGLARAAGLIIGWHEALAHELWARAQQEWHRFVKHEPFWR